MSDRELLIKYIELNNTFLHQEEKRSYGYVI